MGGWRSVQQGTMGLLSAVSNAFGSANRLVVKVDQEAVYTGGVVSGRVYAQINTATAATELRIEVKGEEFAHVVWDDGDGERKNYRHHRASHELLHLDTVLADFSAGGLTAGSYEYPFTFRMPPNLPSTMRTTEHGAAGDRGDCKISYGISVRLHRSGETKSDLKSSTPIMVVAHPQPAQAPVAAFSDPVEQQVKPRKS